MRRAKIEASEMLARRSAAVIRCESDRVSDTTTEFRAKPGLSLKAQSPPEHGPMTQTGGEPQLSRV